MRAVAEIPVNPGLARVFEHGWQSWSPTTVYPVGATSHRPKLPHMQTMCWRRLLDAAPDPTAERAALQARQPIGRMVTAEEAAHAIAYLASPLAGSTTGTILAVDGGMHGLRPRQVPPR